MASDFLDYCAMTFVPLNETSHHILHNSQMIATRTNTGFFATSQCDTNKSKKVLWNWNSIAKILAEWHLREAKFVQSNICAKQHLRQATFAPSNICAKQHLRQATFAPSNICAKQHLRQATFAPSNICVKQHLHEATFARSRPEREKQRWFFWQPILT